MDRIMRALFKRGAVVFLLLGIIACAAIPRLNVTYGLPSKAGEYSGTPVFLTVQDNQPTREILGSGARKDFGGAPVSLALAVRRGAEEAHGVGVFDLPMLLREGFKRRIEHAGLEVSPERRAGVAEISILLKDFFLDLVDRKWRFVMAYEARLVKDGKVLSSQTINGNAERLKIYGHKQADEVVAEVFTDTLNQFDPNRLLRRAGL
jgi:hypothetical protein